MKDHFGDMGVESGVWAMSKIIKAFHYTQECLLGGVVEVTGTLENTLNQLLHLGINFLVDFVYDRVLLCHTLVKRNERD